jgi:phospholipid/cholesterol/gamma-HCH transport system substrate-binding protein
LLLIALLGLVWYWLAAGRYETYQIQTHDPVSGLIVDAPVEFHGVEVGKVVRVELTDPHSVSVLLQLRKDAPVTTATIATITSRGLASRGFTGYVYVSLEDSGTDKQPLAVPADSRYRQIRTAPSRSVNLDTAISQAAENVRDLTRLLQTLLDDKTTASLKQSLDSMNRMTQQLQASLDAGTIASLKQSLESIRSTTQLLQKSLDAKTVTSFKQSLDNVHTMTQTLAANSEKMNTIISNAERASRRLEPLLESGSDSARAVQSQVLPQAYEALTNLERLTAALREMTARIERDPSVLIRGTGKPVPGPGEAQ